MNPASGLAIKDRLGRLDRIERYLRPTGGIRHHSRRQTITLRGIEDSVVAKHRNFFFSPPSSRSKNFQNTTIVDRSPHRTWPPSFPHCLYVNQ
jgi:hypothetical protein